jgi:hypothetical protein
MVRLASHNSVHTSTATFHVESTLRGGHLVRVSSIPSAWTGLYRCESSLVLIARCGGAPPIELAIPSEIRKGLLEIISALCPPGRA